MSEPISFAPLAEAVDAFIDSIDPTSLSRRRKRTVRSLEFQARALHSVDDLHDSGFRRADWAVGQQAVIAIPVMVKTMGQRSQVSAELSEQCVRLSSDLALKLKALAEGRPEKGQ